MIPKIIHYCWFGGKPLPEDAKKYIETWKKYCPDYEIKEWNESNFDINCCAYVREAYQAKKWAFITDFVRLRVLYDQGGIYMDTDVEVCKALDELLIYNAWSGFESDSAIPTGTMAACKNNEWIGYLLTYYDERHFIMADGSYDMTTNVQTITDMTVEKYDVDLNNKKQFFGNNYVIFPFDYFCAKSLIDGKVHKTKNTYTIHHFAGSWLSPWGIFKQEVRLKLAACFGKKMVLAIKRFMK